MPRTRNRYRTQFCFIAPGSLLDRYASVSKTHLVLPQVTNQTYLEFYRRKRKEGDLIILDNGAYEMGETIDLDKMITAIKFYTPQVAALPDFLMQDGEKTFEMSRIFMQEVAPQFPGVKWMYIPQSTPGDLQGWYRWLNRGIKEFNPDWIGIPRALATDIATGPNAWLARVDAVEQLTMRGLKTHCLGMANANLKELEFLFWEGCCSIDNSSPIWRGLNTYELDQAEDNAAWLENGTPVDFDWEGKISEPIDGMIKHNMNLILRILAQPEIK